MSQSQFIIVCYANRSQQKTLIDSNTTNTICIAYEYIQDYCFNCKICV